MHRSKKEGGPLCNRPGPSTRFVARVTCPHCQAIQKDLKAAKDAAAKGYSRDAVKLIQRANQTLREQQAGKIKDYIDADAIFNNRRSGS